MLPFSDWTPDAEHACDFVVLVRDVPHPDQIDKNRSITQAVEVPKFSLFSPFHKEQPQDPFTIREQQYRLRPRPYILRAIDVVERNQWMRDIRRATRLLKKDNQDCESLPIWRKWQKTIRAMYVRQEVQALSSALIITNFFLNAYEAQV